MKRSPASCGQVKTTYTNTKMLPFYWQVEARNGFLPIFFYLSIRVDCGIVHRQSTLPFFKVISGKTLNKQLDMSILQKKGNAGNTIVHFTRIFWNNLFVTFFIDVDFVGTLHCTWNVIDLFFKISGWQCHSQVPLRLAPDCVSRHPGGVRQELRPQVCHLGGQPRQAKVPRLLPARGWLLRPRLGTQRGEILKVIT